MVAQLACVRDSLTKFIPCLRSCLVPAKVLYLKFCDSGIFSIATLLLILAGEAISFGRNLG